MWRTRTLLGSGIALVAALATACGGSSSGGTQTVNPASGGGSGASASDLQTHSGPDGKFMTDDKGRTVYIFSKDKSTTSTCSGDCAKEWPPYVEDGSQVVFKGHPLYFFANDTSTGDMNGQGLNDFGGLWSAVTPDGSALTTSEPSSSPSSGGGSSYEWG
jgi:predicted lipoprotein with Yx(FWY)xxD motif